MRIDRYPDRDSWELTQALSEHHDLDPAWILPGNGSLELLWMLALSYLNQDHRVLISGPTFGEYERAARMMGAQTDLVETGPDGDLTPRVENLTQALSDRLYQVVFLCNPNNPTGKYIAGERIARWADEHPGTLFLIDEAYLNFAVDMESIIRARRPNILVLRSMTKDFALAGLRLGYALGHPEVIANLSKVRPPWNVNAPAKRPASLPCRMQMPCGISCE